jgi:ribosomal protein L16 Arg81 hydroxylase
VRSRPGVADRLTVTDGQRHVPTFAELAGDESQFFQAYFDRAPLLRRAALQGDPENVLSIADLDEILYSKAIRFPHVQISRHGDDVPADEFTESIEVGNKLVPDAVIPSRVVEYFKVGSTIAWSALHHFMPNMREMSSALSEKFATQCGVTAMLTPASKQGFYPHCDRVDVFAVQLLGTKDWRVWPTLEARKGDAPHFSASGEELGRPLIETTLNPGDILYLPNGTPHVAATANSVSLHLIVMIKPRRWSELLKFIVAEIIDNDPSFWDVAYLSEERGDTLAESLSGQVQALVGRLEKLDRYDAVARIMKQARPEPALPTSQPLADMVRADGISTMTRVRRSPHAVIADRGLAEDTGRARVSVDGKIYEMHVSVAAALVKLDVNAEVAAGEFLDDRPAENSVRAVQTLCRMGALELV